MNRNRFVTRKRPVKTVIPVKLNKLLIKASHATFFLRSCLSLFREFYLHPTHHVDIRKDQKGGTFGGRERVCNLIWIVFLELYNLFSFFRMSCQTFIFHCFIKDMPAICGTNKMSLIILNMPLQFPSVFPPPLNMASLVLIIIDFLYVICSLSPMAYLVGQCSVTDSGATD